MSLKKSKSGEDYDVIVVGGGSAGCGAAYALKNIVKEDGTLIRVLLIDNQSMLGGTSTNAWVNCFAATPDAPYMEVIFKELLKNNKAKYTKADYSDVPDSHHPSYEETLLHSKYVKSGSEYNICVDPVSLAEKYESDFKSSNITVKKRCDFFDVCDVENNSIKSILIKQGNGLSKISAKCFIDASGDDILLRKCLSPAVEGEDIFIGSDSFDRYKMSHGFTEKDAKSQKRENLNLPTWMYRIEDGEEQSIASAFGCESVLYNSPDRKYIYVNNVCQICDQKDGLWVIENGTKSVCDILVPRVHPQWFSVKKNTTYSQKWNLQQKKFSSLSPMLGVRETFRANCECMLNENNLNVSFVDSYNNNEGLSKIIAIGNHPVDIHNPSDDVPRDIKVVPYGVPYGCMIPKKMNNLLIASRGAGFTHIGAASFRLNKDMGQLGWAAGKAAYLYVSSKIDDFRDIDVPSLQYIIDLSNTIDKLRSIMK